MITVIDASRPLNLSAGTINYIARRVKGECWSYNTVGIVTFWQDGGMYIAIGWEK